MEERNLRILVNIDTGELAVEESVTGMINELKYGKEITDQKKIERYAASAQINVISRVRTSQSKRF